MAKICQNCGLKYKSFADKCVGCHGRLETVEKTRGQKIAIVLSVSLSSLLLITLICFQAYYYTHDPEVKVRSILRSARHSDMEEILDSLPDFIPDEQKPDEFEIMMMNPSTAPVLYKPVYSFSTNNPQTPSDRQRKELMQTVTDFMGEDFDTSVITDVKFVWAEVRGGKLAYWYQMRVRFVMIEYEDEWCWWPLY